MLPCTPAFLRPGTPGNESYLLSVLTKAKTKEQCVVLVRDGTVPKAAEALKHYRQHWLEHAAEGTSELLLLLRVLCNSCCVGEEAAAVLCSHSVPQAAAGLVHLVTPKSRGECAAALQRESTEGESQAAVEAAAEAVDAQHCVAEGQHQLLRSLARLASNLATASADAARSLWLHCFPAAFERLLASRRVTVHAPTAACLLSCCRAVPGAAERLCSAEGASLWANMLQVLLGPDDNEDGGELEVDTEPNDWLLLLVGHCVLCRGLLPPLLASLLPLPGEEAAPCTSSAAAEAPRRPRLVSCTHVLLHVLAEEVAVSKGLADAGAKLAAAARDGDHPGPMSGLVRMLRELSIDVAAATQPWQQSLAHLMEVGRVAAAECRNVMAAAGGGGAAGGTVSTAARVLEATVAVLKALGQRDDSGAALCGGCDPLTWLVESCGMVHLLLAMLYAIGPPLSGARAQAQTTPAVYTYHVHPSVLRLAADCPTRQPYSGYRADLLAALSNVCLGRPTAARAMAQLGGVEMLLAQCALDESSPLAREWALWGVRNLCCGNADIQARIRDLDVVGVVDSPELQRMGMKLEMNKDTGKLELVRDQAQPLSQQTTGGSAVPPPGASTTGGTTSFPPGAVSDTDGAPS